MELNQPAPQVINVESSRFHKPPQELCLNGNVSENWRRWRQKFDIYMTATKAYKDTDQEKVAVLLSLIGDEALEAYNTFQFATHEDSTNLQQVLDHFESFCTPRKNEVFERYKFLMIRQKEGQSVDQFITELKSAATQCEFNTDNQTEKLIRDRIVIGIRDERLQERLLGEAKLTLKKAADLCRSSEASKIETKEMQRKSEVSSVKYKSKTNFKDNPKKYLCKKCCYSHVYGKCPAYNKQCSNCQLYNHFAKGCPKKKDSNRETKKFSKKKIHANKEEVDESQSEEQSSSGEEEDSDPNDRNAMYLHTCNRRSLFGSCDCQ
jgi:hypothetical protein